MNDPTERRRREALSRQHPLSFPSLCERYGADNVWDTDSLRETFKVRSFLAPFVTVTRISDGAIGSLEFQHSPRFYFDFQIDSLPARKLSP